ncbi:MAG: hypothetical protein IT379_30755 [Deltaproteobacteria bacterium]|nr:hypothetical protein [Deltaproteobacteria bacterium]
MTRRQPRARSRGPYARACGLIATVCALAACKVGGRLDHDLTGIHEERERDSSGRDDGWDDEPDDAPSRDAGPSTADGSRGGPSDASADDDAGGMRAPPSMPPPSTAPRDCYAEAFDRDAPVGDLVSAYEPERWDALLLGVLERRWPAGRALLRDMWGDPDIARWADASSPEALARSSMDVVHDATHGWGYGHASEGRFAFFVREDLTPDAPWIHVFARSEIAEMLPDDATDGYAVRYLTGEQGAAGFTEVVDELHAYTGGLAAVTAAGDLAAGERVRARDGVQASLLFLELYLRRAREVYPELYARMRGETEYVEIVRVIWQRAHFFLEASARYDELGESDDAIAAHVARPGNVAEVSMFVGRTVAISSCLP